MFKIKHPVMKILCLASLFFSQWVSAADLLVDTDWLAKHKQNKDVVLIDMSSDYTQYQRFHIPGATYLDYGNLITYRKKDKVAFSIDDKQLYRLLGLLGINEKSHIVIYDDMGGLNAGRFYWNLERIGHEKISIVDGGLVKWILEGRPVDNKEVTPVKTIYTPNQKTINNNATLAELVSLSANDKTHLLDVRSREEYLGDKKHPRTSGHIPGARFWPWEENVDFSNGFILKDDQTIQHVLNDLSIKNKDDSLILYCRSGHRAAQSYLSLRKLGYNNVKIYDGSMAEYTLRKILPIQQGITP